MEQFSIIKSVIDRAREEKVSLLAASIAYYAFFSIIPLLLLILAIGSLIGGQTLADHIVGFVEDHLSSQGQTVVEQALTTPAGRGGASVTGIVGFVWGGLKVFRVLSIAFDQVYQVEEESSLARQIVDGTLVLTLIGLSAVIMFGLGAVIHHEELIDIPGIDILGWIGLGMGLIVLFFPIFYVMPPVEVRLREVVPGTVFTVFGWFLFQAVFQLYAGNASDYQAYGLLGAVLLFLTWLYFAGILLLLGAAINAVFADR
ncbi:YihY/virulence factor BrkB family protein [Halosolutus gelatinilyticus]|uniref:YihY/virulence factor BrkB family protein n=1 Tax=Halosolutus gelatinilyticus TaxID=2931975 RepID=UPI001FF1C6FA|nr:YihY/virulence factor BrkB family protein [Halosolutus gelatinilyticus]